MMPVSLVSSPARVGSSHRGAGTEDRLPVALLVLPLLIFVLHVVVRHVRNAVTTFPSKNFDKVGRVNKIATNILQIKPSFSFYLLNLTDCMNINNKKLTVYLKQQPMITLGLLEFNVTHKDAERHKILVIALMNVCLILAFNLQSVPKTSVYSQRRKTY